MKIWVLGHQGLLGSAVTAHLQSAGHQVLGTSRDVDITNPAALEDFAALHRPTHIVNCTAFADVNRCESEPELAQAVNHQGPGHLARIASAHQAFSLHISTDYVFDGQQSTPYDEEDACHPLNVYGQSKLSGEGLFIDTLNKTGTPGLVLRSSWLFGPSRANFVTSMLKLMQTRTELKVVDDQVGRPTFCADLAQAIATLLVAQPAQRRLHFANKNATSWFGFAAQIAESARAIGFELTLQDLLPVTSDQWPSPAARPPFSVLSTTRIQAVPGITLRTWQEALSEFLGYLHSTQPGARA